MDNGIWTKALSGSDFTVPVDLISDNVATTFSRTGESDLSMPTSQTMDKSLPELLQAAGSSGVETVSNALALTFFSCLHLCGAICYSWKGQALVQQLMPRIYGDELLAAKTVWLTSLEIQDIMPLCDINGKAPRMPQYCVYGRDFYQRLFSYPSLKTLFFHILDQIQQTEQTTIMQLLGFTTELKRGDWANLMIELYQHYSELE